MLSGEIKFLKVKQALEIELKKDKFKKSTLGGCIIEQKDSFILISQEPNLKKSLLSEKNDYFL